jgi:hypothetical protein
MDQMPGSASQGFSDAVNFSGAANMTVLVNMISR